MNIPESDIPYWKRKSLQELTREEWEALCDGCARCCIIKFEDEDTKEIFYTDIVCQYLEMETCQCTRYTDRSWLVPTCLTLSPEMIKTLKWMPETCAYRLIAEGKPLPWWHPLVSGNRETVAQSGASVRGIVISESEVLPDELEDHIIDPS
jgi:uncharacterized protein